MKILGVDPGLTGAMAFYLPDSDTVQCFDMPVHEIKNKKRLDLIQMAGLIHLHGPVTLAVIEDVNAMPRQGVASTFNFGYAAGAVAGAIAACGIRHEFVRPAHWKSYYGLTRDKDLSRRKASQRWPLDAEQWARKKDDGRAEAALLALYGLEILL